ncbi:MAG: SUMF1/EgtB/PvdO family nonheme iron enzyme, partial [Myxococcota bacterium]
ALLEALEQCDAFLAVIGARWHGPLPDGASRIDSPEDWVRREVEAALAIPRMRVIPVLVNGAPMPTAEGLPGSLARLSARHAARIEPDPDFHVGMDRLLRSLGAPSVPIPAADGPGRTIDAGGVPLELVWVPPGDFQMGAEGPTASAVEGPMRQVVIGQGFWLSRYPITVAQYRAFLDATGSFVPSPIADRDRDTRPVTDITFQDAMNYATWLHTPQGEMGALPTEAEWEWAARGSDGRRFPWGNDTPHGARAVWAAVSEGQPAAVGGRPEGRGPFGAEDQAGNVWEFCLDAWGGRQLEDAHDPVRRDDEAERHVVRGGAWGDAASDLRATLRLGSRGGDDVGFRITLRPKA